MQTGGFEAFGKIRERGLQDRITGRCHNNGEELSLVTLKMPMMYSLNIFGILTFVDRSAIIFFAE
jgi:hypothetical protein